MPEMDSRDVVVMKSECREAGQGLGELGRTTHKALVPTEEQKMAADKLQVLIEVAWKQTLSIASPIQDLFFTSCTDVALFGTGFQPISSWNSTLVFCFRSLKADLSTFASFSELFQAS